MKDLGIVVVNYHTDSLLRAFLDSLKEFAPKSSYDVIIQDVHRTAPTKYLGFDALKHNFYEDNIGYARACNLGAQQLKTKYLAFFNADTKFVNDTCLDTCVDYLKDNPDVGAVGPLQYDSSGAATHAGIFGSNEFPKFRGWKQRDLDSFRDVKEALTVSGSAYFTPTKLWKEMTECETYQKAAPGAEGGFLPTPLYYEETFYSFHLRQHNYKVMYLGTAEMIHEWAASSTRDGQIRGMALARKIFREACDVHGIAHE